MANYAAVCVSMCVHVNVCTLALVSQCDVMHASVHGAACGGFVLLASHAVRRHVKPRVFVCL